jgi:hypothetical protein
MPGSPLDGASLPPWDSACNAVLAIPLYLGSQWHRRLTLHRTTAGSYHRCGWTGSCRSNPHRSSRSVAPVMVDDQDEHPYQRYINLWTFSSCNVPQCCLDGILRRLPMDPAAFLNLLTRYCAAAQPLPACGEVRFFCGQAQKRVAMVDRQLLNHINR